jgi:hypothetical protein
LFIAAITVLARDGRRHIIHYSTAEDTGMIGAS